MFRRVSFFHFVFEGSVDGQTFTWGIFGSLLTSLVIVVLTVRCREIASSKSKTVYNPPLRPLTTSATFDDGVYVIKALLKNGGMVPGEGATEVELAMRVERLVRFIVLEGRLWEGGGGPRGGIPSLERKICGYLSSIFIFSLPFVFRLSCSSRPTIPLPSFVPHSITAVSRFTPSFLRFPFLSFPFRLPAHISFHSTLLPFLVSTLSFSLPLPLGPSLTDASISRYSTALHVGGIAGVAV